MRKRLSVRKILIVSILAIAAIVITFTFLNVKQDYTIKAAVLYSGDSGTYQGIYQKFDQPLLMNLEVEALDISEDYDLSKYDMLYPDVSVKSSKADQARDEIISYVEHGGAVFLENAFYDWFPNSFTGAGSFKELTELPAQLGLPDVRYDFKPLQGLIRDYYEQFKKFRKQDEIKVSDLGLGMIADTAVPLVKAGDVSLYTVNHYEKGYVFFTNPLLPNDMYVNSFDLKASNENQVYFNNTVAAADQMLINEFAGFLSKQKYGYALKKVFGPYGRPAMSFQNHFEVLSAIKEDSIPKWFDITKQYDLIPSFSFARGFYEWSTRHESIGYHLNRAENGGLEYGTEEYEAFYAAGRHVAVENEWLTQSKSPSKFGFFQDIGDIPDRAYPFVEDFNGDGIPDIVSGSSDGYFYYYIGVKSGDYWELKKPEKLKLPDGKIIRVDGFSSPVLFDIDGDNHKDLISGSINGEIYLFINDGNFNFTPQGHLLENMFSIELSAPDIGDLDGDGIADLVTGSKSGLIYFFKGNKAGIKHEFTDGVNLTATDGKELKSGNNSAPRIIDFDNEGNNDLVSGTYDGYIEKFKNNNMRFSNEGFFSDEYKNYLGNTNIKNGNNAVPAFADLDGDNKLDLIVGRLEFGMAVAIDSPYFPYKEKLQSTIEFIKDNYIGLESHNFTHIYKDSNAEKRELEMHRKAFETLGIPWEGTGTNQHTWKVNYDDSRQTVLNQFEAGLSWNSGFEPAKSNMDPSNGSENTWILPFYLYEGITASDMLVFNTSPGIQELYGYMAAWDTPVSNYLHMEYDGYKNHGVLRQKADFLDRFRDTYDYNFMTEQQMAKSFASTLNTSVRVEKKLIPSLFYLLQNKIRTFQQFQIFIRPEVAMDGKGLLDGPYRGVAGVKIEVGEKYLSAPLDTDADIYMRKGNDLYIGLNKKVGIFPSKNPEQRTHIVRVNMPVEIINKGDNLEIDFKEGGMQQIKLYIPDNRINVGEDWKTSKTADGMYVLTRYGGPVKLELKRN